MKRKTQKGGILGTKTHKLYLYFTLEKYSNNNNHAINRNNRTYTNNNAESVNISNNVQGQRIIYPSSNNTEELQGLLEDILPDAVETLKMFAEISENKLYNEFFEKLQVVEPVQYSFKYGIKSPGIMVSYKGPRSVIAAVISRKNSDVLDHIAYGGDGDEILGQELEEHGYTDAHRISFELVKSGGSKTRKRLRRKI